MAKLEGQHIVVGVTGGIAAYKAAELVRELGRAGARVRVVMTSGAQDFITPLTFEALTGERVSLDAPHSGSDDPMPHISLARWADLLLIAPATADFMARMAAGLANDLLSTLCLAFEGPQLLAPAMNQSMWLHPATQANRQRLESRGVSFLGPEAGDQACGDQGPGRMLEPQALIDRLCSGNSRGKLRGLHLLLTAGPTREPLDPVRFLSNRSSGKMGYALASAAVRAGATVTLVSGPTALESPRGVSMIRVETAAEMAEAVRAEVSRADLFMAAAAVADFAPPKAASKIKKAHQPRTLELIPTLDILKMVASLPRRPFCIGFAAETEDLEAQARKKLIEKSLDLVLANLVADGLGFECEENTILALWPEGQKTFPKQSKTQLAIDLIDLIGALYHARRPAQNP